MYCKIQEAGYLGKQIGIGYKSKKMYSCYADKYINEWAKSWNENATPEDFGYKKMPEDFPFDHYVNFETGEVK